MLYLSSNPEPIRQPLLLATEISFARPSRRRRRGSSICSATTYWLLVKPFVALWITIIPYGYATLVLECLHANSWLLECAAGCLWLLLMVLWPNPREFRMERLLSNLGRIRIQCLQYSQPRHQPVLVPAVVQDMPAIEHVPERPLIELARPNSEGSTDATGRRKRANHEYLEEMTPSEPVNRISQYFAA